MTNETIDAIVKLINKLKKEDSDVIPLAIFFLLLPFLFDRIATTLTNNPNAYPYPLNIVFPILMLGFIMLLIVFIAAIYIIKKMKFKDDVEDYED